MLPPPRFSVRCSLVLAFRQMHCLLSRPNCLVLVSSDQDTFLHFRVHFGKAQLKTWPFWRTAFSLATLLYEPHLWITYHMKTTITLCHKFQSILKSRYRALGSFSRFPPRFSIQFGGTARYREGPGSTKHFSLPNHRLYCAPSDLIKPLHAFGSCSLTCTQFYRLRSSDHALPPTVSAALPRTGMLQE